MKFWIKLIKIQYFKPNVSSVNVTVQQKSLQSENIVEFVINLETKCKY